MDILYITIYFLQVLTLLGSTFMMGSLSNKALLAMRFSSALVSTCCAVICLAMSCGKLVDGSIVSNIICLLCSIACTIMPLIVAHRNK